MYAATRHPKPTANADGSYGFANVAPPKSQGPSFGADMITQPVHYPRRVVGDSAARGLDFGGSGEPALPRAARVVDPASAQTEVRTPLSVCNRPAANVSEYEVVRRHRPFLDRGRGGGARVCGAARLGLRRRFRLAGGRERRHFNAVCCHDGDAERYRSGGAAGSPTPRGPGGGFQIAMNVGNATQGRKFSACMRSHGVSNFPDPNGQGVIQISSGAGIDPRSPVFTSARSVCQSLLPNGGQPTAQQQAKAQQQMLAFSVCMRGHGIKDFPDPSGGGVQLHSGPGSDPEPEQPAVPDSAAGLPEEPPR